jgi:pimeloyl-ACP methyl ester carboxylesterase
MNFLGISYGTQLALQYASLFPKNIRTLVLDGVLLHSQSESMTTLSASIAYEDALSKFLDLAGDYEFSPLNGQDARKLWNDLLTDKASSNNLDAEDIRFNAQQLMSSQSANPALPYWDRLANALLGETRGEETSLDVHYSPNYGQTLSVICLDWPRNVSGTLGGFRAQELQGSTFFPLTQGASIMWKFQHDCLGWPLEPTNAPQKLWVDTEATVLVVGATGDSTTGYPWTLGILDEIKNRVLATRIGYDHTSWHLRGEMAEVINNYLITGEAPQDGLVTNS